MEKYSKILIGSTIMLIMTICCPSRIAAQHCDTLPYNVGVPQFFIKNPLDSMHVIADDGARAVFMCPFISQLCKDRDYLQGPTHGVTQFNGYSRFDTGDYAVGFYPDSALTVIGVAWCDHLTYNGNDTVSLIIRDSCEVRLYVPEMDAMILRADKRMAFDTFVTSKVYASWLGWSERDSSYLKSCNGYATTPIPVYEAYFDREISVSDSFYVSVKDWEYNRTSHLEERWDRVRCWTEGFLNLPLSNYDTVRRFPVQSFRVQEGQGGLWRYGEMHCYPLLFPIVRRACDSCPEVQGLRWSRLGNGTTAFVQWDAGVNHRDWQLSYGPSGTPAGEGTVVDCPPAQCVLPGLAAGHPYDIYVRARCRFARDEWTGWSGPLEVGFGNPGEGIDEAAGLHAELTPNPATGRVKVACAEALRMVEVYDLQGRRCLAQEAQGTETVLDISTLAAGRYTVLLHTATTTAARPLIVQ